MSCPFLPTRRRLTCVLPLFLALGLSAADVATEDHSPTTTNTVVTIQESSARPGQASAGRTRSRDSFGLVGIASYGTKRVALFDGSDSAFKQMLHPGEKIGSFTLMAIEADHVDLQSQTNLIRLSLLKQLRRDGNGDWQVLDLSTPFTSPNTRPTSATGSSERRNEPSFNRTTGDSRTARSSTADSGRSSRTLDSSRTDRASLGPDASSSRQRFDDSSRRQSRRTERSSRSPQ